MLVLHGDATYVACTRYGKRDIWTSGVGTNLNVLKPYMGPTIVHIRNEQDLIKVTWNLKGVYVINSGPWALAERVVDRGGVCIQDSFVQGLYRLRNI
jgi:hypothetical protein